MKLFLPLFAVALMAISCNSKKSEVTAEVGDAIESAATAPQVMQGVTYNVNAAESQVMWTGRKVVGDSHTGTLTVSEGRLMMGGDKLVGGEFTIDMNSLTNTDIADAKSKGNLEGHLKNEDFFEVSKFPTAEFKLLQVQPVTGDATVTHNLTGNLTLKGVTKSITVPANIIITDAMISAVTPAFDINRTDWGVKYGSGLTGAVGDKVISDQVALVISLKATRG
ncbi:MAG: YceI family protein [Saprospiraceae bacterium]